MSVMALWNFAFLNNLSSNDKLMFTCTVNIFYCAGKQNTFIGTIKYISCFEQLILILLCYFEILLYTFYFLCAGQVKYTII